MVHCIGSGCSTDSLAAVHPLTLCFWFGSEKDWWGESQHLVQIATMCDALGEHYQAQTYWRDCLIINRSMGCKLQIALAHGGVGRSVTAQGREAAIQGVRHLLLLVLCALAKAVLSQGSMKC